MKFKKKILSLILISIMCITLCTPNIIMAKTQMNGKKDIDVKIENLNPLGITKYSFVILTVLDKESGNVIPNLGKFKIKCSDSRGGSSFASLTTNNYGECYWMPTPNMGDGVITYIEIDFDGNDEYNSFKLDKTEWYTFKDQSYETKNVKVDAEIQDDNDTVVFSFKDDDNNPIEKYITFCGYTGGGSDYKVDENGIVKIKDKNLFNNRLKLSLYSQVINDKYYVASGSGSRYYYIIKLEIENSDVKKGEGFKGQIKDADNNLAVKNKCIALKLSDGTVKDVNKDGSFTLSAKETLNCDSFTLFIKDTKLEIPLYPDYPEIGVEELTILGNNNTFKIKKEETIPSDDEKEDNSHKTKPVKDNTSDKENKPHIKKTSTDVKSPNTYDNTNLTLISLVFLISVLGVLFSVRKIVKIK